MRISVVFSLSPFLVAYSVLKSEALDPDGLYDLMSMDCNLQLFDVGHHKSFNQVLKGILNGKNIVFNHKSTR